MGAQDRWGYRGRGVLGEDPGRHCLSHCLSCGEGILGGVMMGVGVVVPLPRDAARRRDGRARKVRRQARYQAQGCWLPHIEQREKRGG